MPDRVDIPPTCERSSVKRRRESEIAYYRIALRGERWWGGSYRTIEAATAALDRLSGAGHRVVAFNDDGKVI